MNRILECQELVVYDLETTGLNPLVDRIIEIAAIQVVQEKGKFREISRFHKYFKLPPDIPLSEDISRITGIKRKQLDREAFEEECVEQVKSFFKDIPVVGYNNSAFDDFFMLQYMYRNANRFMPKSSFDILLMARDIIPVEATENFKLETIANRYGIEAIRYHSAFSDTVVTLALLNHLVDHYQKGELGAYCGYERPSIQMVSYWGREAGEEERSLPRKRIYVEFQNNINEKVYYDIVGQAWYSRTNTIDMEWLEHQCWLLVGSDTEEVFSNFRGKKRVMKKAS